MKTKAVSLDKRQQETKTRRSSEAYMEAIAHILFTPFAPAFYSGGWAIGERYGAANYAAWFISLLAFQAFAGEYSALVRVTVYWPGKGSGANAAWNGARLNEGHCAVNPKKIPYDSKANFHDAECLAVDSGPDVVNRKTDRSSGRNAAERNAIVIDRFLI